MNPSFVAFNVVKALFLSRSIYLAALLATAGFLFSPASALAHHPFGGETPDTAVSGFLSGLAHPVIGFDHLVFVIASGLLAIIMRRGLFIPIAFAIASLMGTGIHLISLDLPAPEFFISASVLLFGVLLAVKQQPNNAVVIVLAAIAGLFHGYAYGEAIIGAEMAPLVAYLLGFALIQLAIALAAYWIGRAVLKNAAEHSRLSLRFAGFVICGVGATFVATFIMDTILPS